MDDTREKEQQPETGEAVTDTGVQDEALLDNDETGLTEADVLREELEKAQEGLEKARVEASEFRDRYIRARSDLENFRKRAAQENERAREEGADRALAPVFDAFDDLSRALSMAQDADPAQIVPGVQAVLEKLERNLDSMGIERIGDEGDQFDHDFYEALSTVPTEEPEKAQTVAQVFQHGFRKGDRLIRPARVIVYQSQE